MKRINKQHHSKQKEFVCSTDVIRKPSKLYYINKDGNLIETIMGHRNPNHEHRNHTYESSVHNHDSSNHTHEHSNQNHERINQNYQP